jgi:uncharacterized protein (DUF1697 family)
MRRVTTYVALLRAVNVGGTGKLPMRDLVALCESEGLAGVRTYVASGNVVFASERDGADVKAALASRLARYAGRPVGVIVRTAAELAAALAACPFADGAPERVVTTFLDEAPPADALERARHRTTERLALGAREIYVDYGDRDAMAGSRLVIPAAAHGTARNMNTVARLAQMARGR